MRLNGWQRVMLVLAVLWTLFVGVWTVGQLPTSLPSLGEQALDGALEQIAQDTREILGLGLDPTNYADRHVQVVALSRKIGLPASLIERNFDAFRTGFLRDRAADLRKLYPDEAPLSDEELVSRASSGALLSERLSEEELVSRGILPGPLVRPNQVDERMEVAWFALMLWLLPPLALYAAGLTVRWVYRGFNLPPATPE